MHLIILALSLLPNLLNAQDFKVAGQIRSSDSSEGLVAASVALDEGRWFTLTDENGTFELEGVDPGSYTLSVELLGYTTYVEVIEVSDDVELDLRLAPAEYLLDQVTVGDEREAGLSQTRLRNVEGTAIYAGRKSELILPEELTANLATNNAREIYKGIAGLTVWENDGGGLQLAISARGLDPNRTSNFNVRQNGFDISADALGYPESYYTPPAQALARIELVRGAASLQYGTQFGGLLNFKLKEGSEEDPFHGTVEQTVGSFGLRNTFLDVGGHRGKTTYYGFYQYKRGDGWRENSGFDQHTAYLDVHHQFTPKLRLGLELTHMNYLAQQPGGLVDWEFEENPRLSKRERNWFRVDWNLAALHLDYDFSEKTRLNVRTFALHARRDALGELGPINRPDPGTERDLIVGQYQNFGSEARLLHRYQLAGQPATFVVGLRYYRGFAENRQGDASATAGPDFRFLNPEDLEQSDYDFPSRNVSLFAEQLINLGDRWTVTPGVRWEYIRTASEGYFRQRVFSGGRLIFDQRVEDEATNVRSFPLFGLGLSYRLNETNELYGNLSQNYRSINFTDLVVANPNLIVDSLLRDESGYNAEIGIRGEAGKGAIHYDASLFYLRYNDRIGLSEVLVPDPISIERLSTLRSNVGDAGLFGAEVYAEADVARLLRKGQAGKLQLRPFVNVSYIRGEYLSGTPAIVGNRVELVPPVSLKTGISAHYGRWRGQYLYTFVDDHFSDATNAVRVADATRGIIPAYAVMDVSASYEVGRFRFQSGINNLTDRSYFTRRATGYPGPGIIPAERRRWYVSVRLSL